MIDPTHADLLAPITTRLELPPGFIVLGNGPAPPVDPAGHGGHTLPPPGALTYHPTRRLREEVLHHDHICRYPLCGRPAHECELDHLIKFNHADPEAGGWTIAYNLIPLCTPDHHRKHLGGWIPTMHTDRTITWHNPETGEEITTYPR